MLFRSWVYERISDLSFARRRIAVSRVIGTWAVITRGPDKDVPVVTAGVPELAGVEFGFAK